MNRYTVFLILCIPSFVLSMQHLKYTNQMHHHGMYGNYPMERELSGTSWQPDTTPWYGLDKMTDTWHLMTLGFINFIYDHQGGPRGGKKFFSTNMLMFMAQRDFKKGTLAFRSMFSLDALMGKCGYPLLFQTGETANGRTPLIDRQHPHDLFMELAGVYSAHFNEDNSLFLYFGLPGEPALGPPVYFMRYTGTYNPEAPLGHHWLDSTHIQFGVATIGYIRKNLKIDASFFTGREPDQHRFDFEKPRFDSFSLRGTYNPTPDISMQISHAWLTSPEQLEPDVDIDRTTASIAYNKNFIDKDLQLLFAWGRNKKHPGSVTNAFLFEYALNLYENYILFGRAERVDKDELFLEGDPLFGIIFKINKITLGGILQFNSHHFQWGFGFLGSFYPAIPCLLKPIYGNRPLSYMVFLQIRLRE